jgi:copper resistance protein B
VILSARWLMPVLLSVAAGAQAQPGTQTQPGSQTQPGTPAPTVDGQPPQPPAMGPMSPEEMRRLMQMDDSHRFGTLMVDELEWRGANGQQVGAWDAQGWYGGDSDKAWLKTEGVHSDRWTAASAELLWDRVVSPWWSAQAGVRSDFGTGPSRSWLALGLEGVAPYMLDTEATLYVGESGRTAARVKMEYDLYLTQRLVLRPKAEVNAYGKRDSARALGSGVSDLELGARLRYEFRRELAPYIGVDWSRMFGATADLARADGRDAHDLQLTVGMKFWF